MAHYPSLRGSRLVLAVGYDGSGAEVTIRAGELASTSLEALGLLQKALQVKMAVHYLTARLLYQESAATLAQSLTLIPLSPLTPLHATDVDYRIQNRGLALPYFPFRRRNRC